MNRPLILISNDDGFQSEGIRTLALAMAPLGEVVVVAPLTDQSAVSHSMTLRRPLRMKRQYDLQSGEHSIPVFSVDGTPTDCICMGAHHMFKGRTIDLVVSGINHGANLGIDVLYSGTVSAAMEAAQLGIQAVAFSLVANHSEDFAEAGRFAHTLGKSLLQDPMPKGTFLNVNIPKTKKAPGFVATSIGHHEYTNAVDVRTDPRGQKYYWIGGQWNGFADLEGSDCKAIAEGQISVTPVQVQLTNEKVLPWVEKLALENC